MDLREIVRFWGRQHRTDGGQWIHPDDESVLAGAPHTFNLDHPLGPFVGDILRAPVILLGAYGGYDPEITPTEFPDDAAIDRYVQGIRSPSEYDWSHVPSYYRSLNYAELLADGQLALINACAYRSPSLSGEPVNRELIEHLPSTAFNRRWLLDAVLPLAAAGERLVLGKRPGLWRLPHEVRTAPGVIFDPAPVSAQITRRPLAALHHWLTRRGRAR